LVVRNGNKDDRRQVKLVITPKGAEVMDAARAATLERIDGELAGLDKEQRLQLGNAMELLRRVFDPSFMTAGKERGLS
jgi:DNA-binding MarR family transcriptional regulator